MKPYYFFKYFTFVVQEEANSEDGLIDLQSLLKVLQEEIGCDPIEYIQMIFKLDMADIVANHLEREALEKVQSLSGEQEKGSLSLRRLERSLSRNQVELLCESGVKILISSPPGGLKRRICYRCCEFATLPKILLECKLCWRKYHLKCDSGCVCYRSRKREEQRAKADVPKSLMKILGLENSLTMADTDFLKKLFMFISKNKLKIKPLPSPAKTAESERVANEKACQAASTLKDETPEILPNGLPRNAPKPELIQAVFNSKMVQAKLKLKKHNTPRCAKCFKRANCQVNCCEFHLYCDSCRYEDQRVLSVSCDDRDLVSKKDVNDCRTKMMMASTKLWVHEKEGRTMSKIPYVDIKEIYDDAVRNSSNLNRDCLPCRKPVTTGVKINIPRESGYDSDFLEK